jgi:hypothetical protein
MNEAKPEDLPIVLEERPLPRAIIIIVGIFIAVMGSVLGWLAWQGLPDLITLPIFALSALHIWFAFRIAKALSQPFRLLTVVTIHSSGISILRNNTVSEYAWRDIVSIGHAGAVTGMDMVALQLSTEMTLRRIKAKSYSGNPNLVYLSSLHGFKRWDLSPVARLIDRYRQACTGLPSIYLG